MNDTGESNLPGVFGLEGDDADEFLKAFADHFKVDMTGFRDYFHYNANEPPYYRTCFPVDASGKVIPDIPITISQLVRAAESGIWDMEYPAHRVDHSVIPQIVIGVLILTVVVLGGLHLWHG